MSKVAVFGAGSWGTAFSIVLSDAGNDVTIWGRREDVCATINEKRENTDYLPGIELDRRISATHDPEQALAGAETVVLAVPSQTLRQNLEEWAPHIPADAVLVSLMKGVELGSLKRMSEVIAEVTGAAPERIAVVSGPNLAKPIAHARAGRLGRRLRGRGGGPADPGPQPHPVVPPLHLRRRARLRARRCLQERRRPRRRHGRRPRLRRQHHRLGDHPRHRRDGPPRDGARRQPDDADGPGRPRRPGRHLLLAAVAQPDLRREARPGDDHRRDHRLDTSGRRGREVLPLAARARRTATVSTHRSPSTSTPSSPGG